MKNKHEPSNFELQQEIKRLENKLESSNSKLQQRIERLENKLKSSNLELQKIQSPLRGKSLFFWLLVVLFLACFYVILMHSIQGDIITLCTILTSVFSFVIGIILPDLRHKL